MEALAAIGFRRSVSKLIDWLRKKMIRKGKVIVCWPAKDLREDRMVVDVSKLDQNIVGFRCRRYGVYRRSEPPPEYDNKIVFVPLKKLWQSTLNE